MRLLTIILTFIAISLVSTQPTNDVMNKEVKDLFDNLIEVGYKIRISKDKDVSLFPNYNYGFLVKEIYESVIEPTNASSELYQDMLSLVNSESLKEFMRTILARGLIPFYKVRLNENENRESTSLDMQVNSKTFDGITELTIGSDLKVYESYQDGHNSYYGMNKFRRGIIVLQILLGICGDQQISDKLKSLTINIEHTDYGVTHWVPRWQISSVISTTEKSWKLLNNALEDFNYSFYLQENNVSIACGNIYDALRFNHSDLTEYFESIIGVDSDEENSDSDEENSDSDEENSDSDEENSDSDEENFDSDEENFDSDEENFDSDEENFD